MTNAAAAISALSRLNARINAQNLLGTERRRPNYELLQGEGRREGRLTTLLSLSSNTELAAASTMTTYYRQDSKLRMKAELFLYSTQPAAGVARFYLAR